MEQCNAFKRSKQEGKLLYFKSHHMNMIKIMFGRSQTFPRTRFLVSFFEETTFRLKSFNMRWPQGAVLFQEKKTSLVCCSSKLFTSYSVLLVDLQFEIFFVSGWSWTRFSTSRGKPRMHARVSCWRKPVCCRKQCYRHNQSRRRL